MVTMQDALILARTVRRKLEALERETGISLDAHNLQDLYDHASDFLEAARGDDE